VKVHRIVLCESSQDCALQRARTACWRAKAEPPVLSWATMTSSVAGADDRAEAVDLPVAGR
jgi:hypothetical protein